jgi:hypothetical protein
MAILSLAVAPQINGILSSFRLGGATKVVWGDLHKARLTAIKEGRTMRVDFTSNSYNIVRVDTDEIVSRRMLSIDYPGVIISIPVKPKITGPVFMLEGLMRLAPAMRDIALQMPLGSAPAVRHVVVRGYTPLASG